MSRCGRLLLLPLLLLLALCAPARTQAQQCQCATGRCVPGSSTECCPATCASGCDAGGHCAGYDAVSEPGAAAHCVAGHYGAYCGASCKPPTYHCKSSQCTVNGNCVGYAGLANTDVASHCQDGFYSPDCDQKCMPPQYNCQTGRCSVDGNCETYAQFKEPGVAEHCKQGWYSADCDQKCDRDPYHCATRTCTVNGNCEGYGALREPDQASHCVDGWYSADCDQKCQPPTYNCMTGKCTVNGNCEGFALYSEPQAADHCQPGWYSADCDQRCQPPSYNCAKKKCTVNGNCEGWARFKEPQTAEHCVDGWYSPDCDQKCQTASMHCKSKACSVLGYCADWAKSQAGCKPVHCEDGYYGKSCSSKCPTQCMNGCDLSGNCVTNESCGGDKCPGEGCRCTLADGCKTGPSCEKTCEPECKRVCPKGSCTLPDASCGDCPRGFYGHLCEKRCGQNCIRCDDLSVPDCRSNGKCSRCALGFSGENCSQKSRSWCAECYAAVHGRFGYLLSRGGFGAKKAIFGSIKALQKLPNAALKAVDGAERLFDFGEKTVERFNLVRKILMKHAPDVSVDVEEQIKEVSTRIADQARRTCQNKWYMKALCNVGSAVKSSYEFVDKYVFKKVDKVVNSVTQAIDCRGAAHFCANMLWACDPTSSEGCVGADLSGDYASCVQRAWASDTPRRGAGDAERRRSVLQDQATNETETLPARVAAQPVAPVPVPNVTATLDDVATNVPFELPARFSALVNESVTIEGELVSWNLASWLYDAERGVTRYVRLSPLASAPSLALADGAAIRDAYAVDEAVLIQCNANRTDYDVFVIDRVNTTCRLELPRASGCPLDRGPVATLLAQLRQTQALLEQYDANSSEPMPTDNLPSFQEGVARDWRADAPLLVDGSDSVAYVRVVAAADSRPSVLESALDGQTVTSTFVHFAPYVGQELAGQLEATTFFPMCSCVDGAEQADGACTDQLAEVDVRIALADFGTDGGVSGAGGKSTFEPQATASNSGQGDAPGESSSTSAQTPEPGDRNVVSAASAMQISLSIVLLAWFLLEPRV